MFLLFICTIFQVECSIHLLKGYIYEATDNRALAAESFRAAIQADPLCYEAVQALTQHHMLTAKEGQLSNCCHSINCTVIVSPTS